MFDVRVVEVRSPTLHYFQRMMGARYRNVSVDCKYYAWMDQDEFLLWCARCVFDMALREKVILEHRPPVGVHWYMESRWLRDDLFIFCDGDCHVIIEMVSSGKINNRSVID